MNIFKFIALSALGVVLGQEVAIEPVEEKEEAFLAEQEEFYMKNGPLEGSEEKI